MSESSRLGFPPRGLYVLTPEPVPAIEELEAKVAAAIAGGAVVIQYRDKNGERRLRLERAGTLLAICHAHGVPLIINDDIELAVEIKADGVHVGKNDASLESARQAMGSRAIIGVSCYDSAARAITAAESGADYVALGSFFPSTTKPEAVHCSKSVLVEVAAIVRRPIVAIGGITPDNAAELVSAGADLVAVITGLFAATNVRNAARELAGLF